MKYICSSCGTEYLKWSGKCPECGQWGTLEEIDDVPSTTSTTTGKSGQANGTVAASEALLKYKNDPIDTDGANRKSTGFSEFDRVLGKGIMPGEVVLLAGEPGVGKSTLLMQLVLKYIEKGAKVLYVCGEESPSQLISRLKRLTEVKNEDDFDNFIATEDTTVENVAELIESDNFDLVVVDSIQSMISMASRTYPGSISQVRLCGSLLTRAAKKTNTPIFIVGQINKGGDIAGPKVLEHVVDCVLYMEGDEFNQYRILRSIKNRFGSTNEIGVFEMRRNGLEEVGNPSLLFMETKSESSGSAIGVILQGSRVVFVEVQALIIERDGESGPLRRVANGIKKPRLDMLCAVLMKKGNVFLGNKDVFVNVVGGLNVADPAIDLAVCAAIKSSVNDKILSKKTVYFGEVGLTGEVRGVWGVDSIIEEANRAGYEEIVIGRTKVGSSSGVKVRKLYKISSL